MIERVYLTLTQPGPYNLKAIGVSLAAMAFAISPPSVDINATLEAQLGIVTPALSAFVSFKGYLSASVAAYAYSGPANGLGAAITSVELSSGTTAGIVVATDSPATWATIGQLFKTS